VNVPVERSERRNDLLAALPADEYDALRPQLEDFTLTTKQELQAANAPVEHVYFVHWGVVSIVTELEERAAVEVATIGPEGVVGLPAFLGADRMPSRAFVQVPGEASRMDADAFRRALERNPNLNRLLLRYTLALVNQLAQASACNRIHPVEQRLARWLLMTNDRVRQQTFPLTQEFMGQMLGVQRPTVSITASMLQRAGLISYVRGIVTIVDRAGLEAASCACYRVIQSEFERLVRNEG
jgi:CRP-like cAMP-binding protein